MGGACYNEICGGQCAAGSAAACPDLVRRRMLMRRITTLMLLTAFVAGGTGLGEAAHLALEPHEHDAEHCQVCYIFTIATVALLTTAGAIVLFHAAEARRHAPLSLARPSRPSLTCAAPRAPPGL